MIVTSFFGVLGGATLEGGSECKVLSVSGKSNFDDTWNLMSTTLLSGSSHSSSGIDKPAGAAGAARRQLRVTQAGRA